MSIEGVAVRFNHGGAEVEVRMPKPNRHCDCFAYAFGVLNMPKGSHKNSASNQGFYDHTGKYLNRIEAMEHFKLSGGNCLPDRFGCINQSKYLFSEDAW